MNAENNIKRTKIGVIGGARAYDKAMARIKLLGIEEQVDLILIDEEKYKDKGFHVNQVWIDECKEIPKILIEHTPKLMHGDWNQYKIKVFNKLMLLLKFLLFLFIINLNYIDMRYRKFHKMTVEQLQNLRNKYSEKITKIAKEFYAETDLEIEKIESIDELNPGGFEVKIQNVI